MNRIMVLHGPCRRDPRSDRDPLPLVAIPYAKRLELESRTHDARYASLAGLALALRGLEAMTRRTVALAELRFPLDGKPCIAAGPDFSIAHTDGWVACAVALRGVVGLDLEVWREHEPTVSLERWTAVEAVLKAAGAGLRRAQDVEIDLEARHGRFAGTDYCLHPLVLGTELVAHAATNSSDAIIDVHEVALGEAFAQVARDIGLREAEPA
jgi:phosphopantetheinyl transferase